MRPAGDENTCTLRPGFVNSSGHCGWLGVSGKLARLQRKGSRHGNFNNGLGLVGTSYAQRAVKRGESIVFCDIAPRKDFLAHKLGSANVTIVQRDVRDLPTLVEAMQKYKIDKVIHTAGLIGGKVKGKLHILVPYPPFFPLLVGVDKDDNYRALDLTRLFLSILPRR